MNFNIDMKKNVDFLLIVRGLAAISVVYWHLGGYLFRDDYFASFFIIPGRLAVWIFFMMSGYLIGHGLIYGRYKPNIKGIGYFFFNRILRIYPIFFVVSIVALLYSNHAINVDFILQELLMIQWNHSYSLNGVFWTLGVETHLYLLAPLLVFAYQVTCKKYVNWWGLYLITIILLWLYSESSYFTSWDLRNILGGVSQFVVGIVLAGYKTSIVSVRKNISIALIALLTLVAIMYFNHNYLINLKMILLSHLIGVGLIVLHIMIEKREISLNFIGKILMIFGVLSYGLYAWHGFLTANKFFVDNVILHLIVSMTLSYVTYIVIEHPMLKFKKLKN